MMYAVIETGGKQYRVQNGDKVEVEKLDAAVDAEYVFNKVLFVSGEEQESEIGSPYLDGVKVKGKILKHIKGDKVIVFKMKRRKSTRKKRGHRQNLTVVEIMDIVHKK